ncbi:MAG: radical SAM protein [Proteobacteria bacterium]|nr:radical SAM protein [Pseudomonadota bacterium]MBU1737735.1 radical SAM protein [Pseudomonadota bacterium]
MTHAAVRTVGFKPQERNVFLHILTACNLSCRHCYINPEQHGSAAISEQTMMEWLELFHDPDKETNVIFLGGEPTLHPHLSTGIKLAGKLGYRSVTVDTNGYLFHDLLNRISPEDAVLSFSLDGPDAETNDRIRGEGSFATCTGNLKSAVKKGFKVSVIYTVSRMNLDQLAKMPELLAAMKVNRFFIQVIGLRGKSAADGADLQLTPEEWLEKIPAVAAKTAGFGITTSYPRVFLDEGETFHCAGVVADNYFVFPNGRVYRCPLCEDHPIHSLEIQNNRLVHRPGITEDRLFPLQIPEGCVMNRILQPGNIPYDRSGRPVKRISCCLLKDEVSPIAK